MMNSTKTLTLFYFALTHLFSSVNSIVSVRVFLSRRRSPNRWGTCYPAGANNAEKDTIYLFRLVQLVMMSPANIKTAHQSWRCLLSHVIPRYSTVDFLQASLLYCSKKNRIFWPNLFLTILFSPPSCTSKYSSKTIIKLISWFVLSH